VSSKTQKNGKGKKPRVRGGRAGRPEKKAAAGVGGKLGEGNLASRGRKAAAWSWGALRNLQKKEILKGGGGDGATRGGIKKGREKKKPFSP